MAIIESLTADEIIARLEDKVSSEALSLALALMAPLTDPALTGNPTAPTPPTADNDTSIATTAFVKAQGYAPLDSPALTGNPTAPTPSTADNDTSIATTAFVKAALAALVDSSPATLDTLNELAAALGDDPNFATTVTNQIATKNKFWVSVGAPTGGMGSIGDFYLDKSNGTLYTKFAASSWGVETTFIADRAPLANPAFTGNPTAPTPSTADNDTSIATTAFVKAQGYAPLASPALTGNPTAPTPAPGDNDTSIATTAFVTAAVAAGGGGGGSGMVAYANVAALDAETDTVFGTVLPTTNWGAYTGLTSLNSHTGEALVETVATVRSGLTEITQSLNIGKHTSGYNIRVQRVSVGGSWSGWGWGALVRTPTDQYEAANKLYVDARGLTLIAWADLDTLNGNNSVSGTVTVTGSDLGALTGIAKYNGYPGGALNFENNGAYGDDDYHSAQMQRVWVPNIDGTLDEIRRFRNDVPAWTFNAWSAWAIVAKPLTKFYSQYIPPVGSTFTSGYFDSNTTATLRDRGTAPMPILLDQTIGIDEIRFNLTVLAAAAGQTARIQLKKLNPGEDGWTTITDLATGIPIDSAASVGVIAVSFSQQILEAGVVYGFAMYEHQAYDATLRISQGVMHGPGIGSLSSYTSGWNLPIGANAATVTAVPIFRLRRSS